MKYKSLPTEIEAVQWTGYNTEVINDWTNGNNLFAMSLPVDSGGKGKLYVEKAKAWCNIQVGDYVVKEPDGSGFYPE